jgi:rubrerythrin
MFNREPAALERAWSVTYKQCRNCDFWVTRQDKHCPNCGVVEPRAAGYIIEARDDRAEALLRDDPPMSEGARALLGGLMGAILGAGIVGGGAGVAVGVAIGVVAGVNVDMLWDSYSRGETTPRNHFGPPATAHTTCLRQDERTIQQRLEAIAAREKQLAEARQRVEAEGAAQQWRTVRAALESAAAILCRQRDRYRAKLWEIALVRWQNTLEPLTGDWDHLTHEECSRRLQGLAAARERGENLLREWEHGELTATSAGQECTARLREVLGTCEQLRQALVVQQAALAVKGIAPLDEALQPVLTPAAALKQLDTFNARAAIGEFSSAFGELEAEYARLQSEHEMAEQVQLINRLR